MTYIRQANAKELKYLEALWKARAKKIENTPEGITDIDLYWCYHEILFMRDKLRRDYCDCGEESNEAINHYIHCGYRRQVTYC